LISEGLKSRIGRIGGVGRVALGVVFAVACAAAVAGAARPPASDVLGVRLGGDSNETRIVVDMDRAASGQIDDSDPGEIDLTLADTSVPPGLQGQGRGLVREWSMVDSDGDARLSIDLAGDAVVERRFLLPPADGVARYRYVIDIAVKPGAAAPVQTDAAEIPRPFRAAPAAVRTEHIRKVVVVDAGHGGRDSGALGANSYEKDVTLAAALALKARLERSGRYEVVMTRASDVYVPLETRVQIARRAGAYLFISLHADSGPDAGTHGASVYTLSDHGVGRVGNVLDRRDWFLQPALAGEDHAVSQILLDLTQRSTRNRSQVFAEGLINRVGDRAPLLPRSHRDADYFVLLAPDVPAALLEMGFITNSADESRLNDPGQRGALMDEVADAIDGYFSSESRIAAR
jgi:N-acetylmuramoyl-L-alanine amidase